jgi:hypothetical protein
MIEDKNKKDFNNSIALLKTHLQSFEEGNTLMYLPMAVELRKLLCEKNPSPLITRIIPHLKLYKLHSTELFKNNPSLLDKLVNFMPGRLDMTGNGKLPRFTLSFSRDRELMGLDEWLDQMLFKENITIRELIKSVADKEAAHADVEYNGTLVYCNTWSYNDVGCHIYGIYGIARFVSDLISLEYGEYL